MPTKAFFNLDLKRQEELIKAAEKEFSVNRFENASINQIIKKINMPRGSFYLYFENKEDLYAYILKIYFQSFKKVLFKILSNNNNDLFDSMIALFDYTIKNVSNEHPLISNIFVDMNSKRLNFILPSILKEEVDGCIMDKIDFSHYLIENEEKEVILSIVFPLFFTNISKVWFEKSDKSDIRKFYVKQINLMKKGLERKKIC